MSEKPNDSGSSSDPTNRHKIRLLRIKYSKTLCRGNRCRAWMRHVLKRADHRYKKALKYAEDAKKWTAAALAVASTSGTTTAHTSTAEPVPDYLSYLELMPKDGQPPAKKQKLEDNSDYDFPKPRIYECEYCAKIFFNKRVHVKHTIRHMKKIYWCFKCKQSFHHKYTKSKHRCHISHLRKW